MRRSVWSVLAAMAAFLAMLVVGGAANVAAGSAAPTTTASSVPHYDHIMVAVEENHGLSDVIGNPAAPNINYLAKNFGLATDYFGVTHPSEPNYVALLGGSTNGVNSDNAYYENKVNAQSLISQLDGAGISWKAYIQSLPHPGYQGICYPAKCNGVPDIDPLYVSKHVGISNYTTSLNAADWSRQVPVNQLATDLSANQVPQFSYIIPDECRDMHGDPPYCVDSGQPVFRPDLRPPGPAPGRYRRRLSGQPREPGHPRGVLEQGQQRARHPLRRG